MVFFFPGPTEEYAILQIEHVVQRERERERVEARRRMLAYQEGGKVNNTSMYFE